MKFSIIVPVYNVEKYVKRCLDSIFNQTYKDFEVIVVNDGSTDKSMDIVKKYKDVKIINEENRGLSHARNNGVKNARGDYILFVDSDDYINKDLLKELNKSLNNNPDVVRFQVQSVDEYGSMTKYEEENFEGLSGPEAFKRIVKFHYVENAWCYLYKRDFFIKNNFKYKEGMLHEDFGLTPLIIMKAGNVNSISYIGYNYFNRKGSIMNSNDYEKEKKKVKDFYTHYLYLKKEINKTNLDKKVFLSFISNSLILKVSSLKGKDYKEYKKLLKENNVYNDLLSDTFTRKIKKLIFKISPKLGAKMVK